METVHTVQMAIGRYAVVCTKTSANFKPTTIEMTPFSRYPLLGTTVRSASYWAASSSLFCSAPLAFRLVPSAAPTHDGASQVVVTAPHTPVRALVVVPFASPPPKSCNNTEPIGDKCKASLRGKGMPDFFKTSAGLFGG